MTQSPVLAPTTFAALGAVGCGGAAIGLSFPLMSLNLDDWGVSEAGIGLFTLAAAISTVLATPLTPPVLARMPVRVVLGAALVVIAAFFLVANLVRDLAVWGVLRFCAGAAFSFLFVSAEAWVIERTPAHRRGFVLGLFAATFAGAMALGGSLVSIFGYSGPWAFYAGALVACLGLAALLAPGPGLTAPEGEASKPAALLARIRNAPVVMLAPFAMGAIETAKYNLIPIYARRVGHEDAVATQMITAAGIGVLVLQPAIGALGDRIGAKATLALCACAGIALPFAILAAGAAAVPALAMVFLYSGVITGLYTVGLIWLGRVYAGGELAAANAAFALCYGVGQLIGPAAAGAAFSGAGPAGFMMALAAFAGVYLAFLAAFTLRPARSPTA